MTSLARAPASVSVAHGGHQPARARAHGEWPRLDEALSGVDALDARRLVAFGVQLSGELGQALARGQLQRCVSPETVRLAWPATPFERVVITSATDPVLNQRQLRARLREVGTLLLELIAQRPLCLDGAIPTRVGSGLSRRGELRILDLVHRVWTHIASRALGTEGVASYDDVAQLTRDLTRLADALDRALARPRDEPASPAGAGPGVIVHRPHPRARRQAPLPKVIVNQAAG
jgi:hypothetical protein